MRAVSNREMNLMFGFPGGKINSDGQDKERKTGKDDVATMV